MRKPRELREGARYHVTARTNRREMILEPTVVKELLLGVIKRAKRKYRFRIENFCVMDNHFHLVILPAKNESLSAIMRWILSVFAMAYNRLLGLTGHVWGERFFSRIIEGFGDLIQVFKYIDGNPVKARGAVVGRDWPHGGLWHARTGCREILDEAPAGISMAFPNRSPTSITGPLA